MVIKAGGGVRQRTLLIALINVLGKYCCVLNLPVGSVAYTYLHINLEGKCRALSAGINQFQGKFSDGKLLILLLLFSTQHKDTHLLPGKYF